MDPSNNSSRRIHPLTLNKQKNEQGVTSTEKNCTYGNVLTVIIFRVEQVSNRKKSIRDDIHASPYKARCITHNKNDLAFGF